MNSPEDGKHLIKNYKNSPNLEGFTSRDLESFIISVMYNNLSSRLRSRSALVNELASMFISYPIGKLFVLRAKLCVRNLLCPFDMSGVKDL